MTDPRNIAHAKKVHQEKKHHGSTGSGAPFQPGKKPHHQPPEPGNHGPDPDEPVDKTESGEEP